MIYIVFADAFISPLSQGDFLLYLLKIMMVGVVYYGSVLCVLRRLEKRYPDNGSSMFERCNHWIIFFPDLRCVSP